MTNYVRKKQKRRKIMQKQFALLLTLILLINVALTGCLPCQHEWIDASCTAPLTCSKCGEVAGSPLGHNWTNADCVNPKTCSRCQATEGSPLGHSWTDADCNNPKTCSVCKATEGDPREHEYQQTVTQDASCSTTGELKYTCEHCNHFYTEEFEAETFSSTEIYDRYVQSVGEVITYDATGAEVALGTCFVYTADGELITNYHVIEDACSAKVNLNGKSYNVQYVLAYDKDIDLAVLKINASGLTPVTICEKNHATGATVFALGSSRGLEYTMSQGIITYSNRELDGVVYVQHDAAISGGNSGGPLINEYGEVIGINTMTIRDSQNLNFAISVDEIDNLVFGDPMTMQQVFDKECNPYLRLKNFIINNGTYYSNSGGYYKLLLGTLYSSDYTSKYTRYAYYYVSDGDITLDLLVDDGDYWVYFIIDEDVDGVYSWSYFDDYDYEMRGELYADSYDSDTLLGYSYNNISSSSIRTSVRKLASSMMNLLLAYLDQDLADAGLDAEALGFLCY